MFDRLFYNEKAKATLAALISGGRLPHALLLEGPPLSGRRTLAKMVAAAFLCEGKAVPCGQCGPCRKVEGGFHPDCRTLGCEDGKSLPIDLIRELRANAFVKPGEGRARVTILCDVQYLSIQAQNALLKVMEEPPASAVFILTCDNRFRLLPTILSRVMTIALQQPTVPQCEAALRELKPDLSDEARKAAAAEANGSIGLALQRLQEGLSPLQQLSLELAQALIEGREYDALRIAAAVEKGDFAPFLSHLRAVFVACALYGARPVEDAAIAALRARITRLQAVKIVDIIEEAEGHLRQNMNPSLLSCRLVAAVRDSLNG